MQAVLAWSIRPPLLAWLARPPLAFLLRGLLNRFNTRIDLAQPLVAGDRGLNVAQHRIQLLIVRVDAAESPLYLRAVARNFAAINFDAAMSQFFSRKEWHRGTRQNIGQIFMPLIGQPQRYSLSSPGL